MVNIPLFTIIYRVWYIPSGDRRISSINSMDTRFFTPHSLRNPVTRHLPCHRKKHGTFLDTERVTKSSGPCATTEPEGLLSNLKNLRKKKRKNYSKESTRIQTNGKFFVSTWGRVFFWIVFCLLKKGGMNFRWPLLRDRSYPLPEIKWL